MEFKDFVIMKPLTILDQKTKCGVDRRLATRMQANKYLTINMNNIT